AVAIVAIGGTVTYVTSKPTPPSLISHKSTPLELPGANVRSRIDVSYAGDKAGAASSVVVDSPAVPLRAKTIVSEVAGIAAALDVRRTSRPEGAAVPVIGP